jgi:hypothetical protein
MKKVFTIALGTFLICGLSKNLLAQTPGCTSAAQVVSKMWNAWNQVSVLLPSSVPENEIMAKLGSAVARFNTDVAQGNWATIGPRSLVLNNQEIGNILGNTTRTFVMAPSKNDVVRIVLKKNDGRAKTGVTICTQSKTGGRQTVASYTFNNDNDPETKTFRITDAQNKVISIAIKNYSVGNRFQYQIKAN